MNAHSEPELFGKKHQILRRESIFWTIASSAMLLTFFFLIFNRAASGSFYKETASTMAMLLAVTAVSFGAAAQILRHQWLKLEEYSGMDPLTGTLNRVYFERMLDEELRRAGRYHYPMTLCCVDLDDFNSYNDHFGRNSGDKVLAQFAQLLKAATRFADCVSHLQKDEFFILLPHTDIVHAEKFISRILALVAERMDFGFSAGVTSYQTGESKAQLMMRAVQGLAQAKREGKKKIRYIVGNTPTTVSF